MRMNPMIWRLSSQRVAPLATLIGLAALAHAQALTPPEVPEVIRTLAGETVVLRAHATGVQIYVCGRAADGKPQWTLRAPEAELRDDQGVLIGHHAAGPSWRHNDGSEVTGKATARSESPDADSIPWLLLSATGHAGSGVLARVTSIQRINTLGGQPPPAATCDPMKHKGKEARVPYRADYYFYAPSVN
ncbi:MAG TPA: DUF3455 domain-containing protein [Steroidobacteraceae bacterium]|nr:DUF3455 domain-containing protein [Steroidobacteraceae bacterium]